MRYIITICILFIHLAGSIAVKAGGPAPVNEVSHTDKAALSTAGTNLNSEAEVSRTVQFHCTTFKLSNNRLLVAVLSMTQVSNEVAGKLYTHPATYQFSYSLPLVRLLLFPQHYFW